MKKKIMIALVAVVLLGVTFSLVAVSLISQPVPEFKETVLKDRYTDAAEMEKDMERSKQIFVDYIKKYENKLSKEEGYQLLKEYQQYCDEVKSRSFVQTDPYLECVQNIQAQLDESELRMVSGSVIDETLNILYLNSYLKWLNQDHERYIYDSAIQWAIGDARLQYIILKQAQDAEEIEDPDYAMQLLTERMTFSVEVVDHIQTLIKNDSQLAEKCEQRRKQSAVDVNYFCAQQAWDFYKKNDLQTVTEIVNHYIEN